MILSLAEYFLDKNREKRGLIYLKAFRIVVYVFLLKPPELVRMTKVALLKGL